MQAGRTTTTALTVVSREFFFFFSLHSLNPKSTVAIQWYIWGQKLFTGGHRELSSDHRTLYNITRNDLGFYQSESCNSATSSISNPVLIKVICELRALLKGALTISQRLLKLLSI